jgi:hypothetical protein
MVNIQLGTVMHIQGDRREPDVFEMDSTKQLGVVGSGTRYYSLAECCHFSGYGAVDRRAPYVTNAESGTAAFSCSFQPWTPRYCSQPQYDSQVG